MALIQVRAVATDPDNYLVECTDCEVLGIYPAEECDEVCITHLEAHNVDTAVYRERQKEGEAVEDTLDGKKREEDE